MGRATSIVLSVGARLAVTGDRAAQCLRYVMLRITSLHVRGLRVRTKRAAGHVLLHLSGTFATPGSFPCVCEYHAGMQGTMVVQ